MYAIVETGGKQYMVKEGDTLFVEKLNAAEGDVVTLDKIVAVSKDGQMMTGSDAAAYKVNAKVLAQGKAKKIIVFKYKAKKDYRRKQGHRQPYTKITIESINA
ncbi:large subunit ribosomal protein L21 [Acetoanaerobium noterae]|jgi:large subunit ribosomal protein L21|uniref:Large ribosomal subunit protein bL21 n=3 Tax=root TaxID=1 RepID=E3PRJ0_ACESD|nr:MULTISPECIES: 50S ribosomal protein L21 [Acetoanaerobium]MBP8762635.1 50S ribosomal protein L21 [Acetoanaerobium sp.]MDK2803524.1 large subunit ribosomal protein [Peptostreptococcaceae bacterium]MBP9499511.1 50S ribosomal protein L21 [Acetoanaerobium sp.]MBP9561846.1 50S ribosomal protein L21 [Acetoanaerobium sp.]CBH21494.1 50S ribosomal subunit protein L21 [Acetoanaerobium sticklandii]